MRRRDVYVAGAKEKLAVNPAASRAKGDTATSIPNAERQNCHVDGNELGGGRFTIPRDVTPPLHSALKPSPLSSSTSGPRQSGSAPLKDVSPASADTERDTRKLRSRLCEEPCRERGFQTDGPIIANNPLPLCH